MMSLSKIKFCKHLEFTIKCLILSIFLLSYCGDASSSAADLTREQVRQYIRDTYTIANGTDALLDQALDKYPNHITAPFLDIFKAFIRADELATCLNNRDYQGAVSVAVTYSAELEIRNTFLESLSSTFAIADLAALPIRWGLSDFTDNVTRMAWDRQTELYIWARIMGYSHEFIMAGQSDDTVLFTDDGWLYIVGEKRIPSYAPVRPGDYSRAQMYSSAQESYYAYLATATYPRDKERIGAEFKSLIEPTVTISPQYPNAPSEVSFEISGSSLPSWNIVSYLWEFGDGQTGTGRSTTHYYKNPDRYHISLTLTGNNGDLHVFHENLVVRPPAINITYPNGSESLHMIFSSTESSHVAEYNWNFGDGSPILSGRMQDYTYATQDNYTITLTLTLDDGSTLQNKKELFAGPGTKYIAGHTVHNEERWYSGGTYIVQGGITVDEGASLIIESDVRVEMMNNTRFDVKGALTATDTTFTWADGINEWGGIYFGQGADSNSKLDGCILEHAKGVRGWSNEPNNASVIYLSRSSPTITNCTIRDSSAEAGIRMSYQSMPIISNNHISGFANTSHGYGIYVGGTAGGSAPTVTGNTITGNNYGVFVHSDSSGGVYQGNSINGNYVYGICYTGTSVIDAVSNYWGDPTGPLDNSDDRSSGGLYNPDGRGDQVSDHVNYYPWGTSNVGSDDPDEDDDGMSDWWESDYGLDPFNPNNEGQDPDRDGYSNLQEYANWLSGELDPKGNSFNPLLANTPGATGYSKPSNIMLLVLPALLNTHRLSELKWMH